MSSNQQLWLIRSISLSLFLSIAVSLSLPFFMQERFGFDSFRQVSLRYLLLAIALWIVYCCLSGLRLKLLAAAANRPLSLWQGIRIHILGLFSAAVTPGGSGNAPVMVLGLLGMGVSQSKAWAIVIYTSIMDILAYSWMLPLAFLWLVTHRAQALSLQLIVLALVTMVGLFSLAYTLMFKIEKLDKVIIFIFRLPILKRWYKKVLTSSRKTTLLMAEMSTQTVAWHGFMQVITALAHLSAYSILYTCLAAFGFNLSFWNVISLVLIVSLGGMLVPTPGGSGYMEAAIAFLLPDRSAASVVPAVLTWRLFSHYVNILVGGFIGGVALLKQRNLLQEELDEEPPASP